MKVEALTHLGVGRTETGAFVPRVLPGEVLDDDHRILTPSPDRVAPPCRHFRTCGGCAMQHARDGFVAEWKQGIVERALRAQGIDAAFAPMHTSPPRSRRRAKLSGRRTKKGALVGFHARGSDLIVAVPECQLLRPALMAALPACEALTVIAASRKGEVALTLTDSADGIDLLVETDKPLTPQLRLELAGFAQAHDLARLTWNDETVVTRHPPAQRFGAAQVVPPPGAFLQATAEGETALLETVSSIVGPAARIVDLFAGCGTFALPLAANAEVAAYEGAPEMIAALDRGWRSATGLKRVSAQTRDLFRRPLEPDELRGLDAAVIDPPRAGAEAQVAALARSDVPVIAMVSCNPVTFARDAAALVAAGYTIGPVTVVDQFRWSAHVEMVAGFTRA